MRLIAHNMLSCNVKGVVNNFPLQIEAEKVIEQEVGFNPDFLKHMFAKIDWKALVDGARSMGYTELPDEAPDGGARIRRNLSQEIPPCVA
ncbi:Multifunctional methyltransferase subunit TRM112-like protein [Cardamine amara subsp. amara]|uniref:Multifunctional methyltransferase subunit TRM112-like protein n=1 Tax=Cardamine amara subsp. amara TaxID=228776 RepID=A0ABD1ABN2_CARAN